VIRYYVLSLVLILGLLAGCQLSADSGPPEIRYGEDVCDMCNMIINEPRFATAYASESGDTRRFDDTGEMFLYARNNGETVRAYWVHDYLSETWIEADAATYVHNPQLMTPMGWGIAAFSNAEDAEAYAEENGGELLTFEAFHEGVLNGELMPRGMAQHDH
jgi:copper chaperone NosL